MYVSDVMERNNLSWLVPLILFFGILAGGAGALSIGINSGYIAVNPVSEEALDVSATPGTDILNEYRCARGETKELILGGVEDNYSTAQLEPVSPLVQFKEKIISTSGRRGAMTYDRQYDEPGVDKVLFESFPINGEVAEIFVVVITHSEVNFENDRLILRFLDNKKSEIVSIFYLFSNDSRFQNVTKEDDIYMMELSSFFPIEITKNNRRKKYAWADVSKDLSNLSLVILDDHQVDFTGVVLCKKPKYNNGLTLFADSQLKVPEGVIMQCQNTEGIAKCNPHTGDYSCEQSLPLACFKDEFTLAPDNLDQAVFYNWSGGLLKFTAPVQGTYFKTSDEAHAFCRAQFGKGWRTANLAEGGSNDMFVAKGRAGNVRRAWIESPVQKYANCWEIRSDYDSVNR